MLSGGDGTCEVAGYICGFSDSNGGKSVGWQVVGVVLVVDGIFKVLMLVVGTEVVSNGNDSDGGDDSCNSGCNEGSGMIVVLVIVFFLR